MAFPTFDANREGISPLDPFDIGLWLDSIGHV